MKIKLKLINALLQWFFIRLTKVTREKIILDYTLEVSKDGSFSVFKTKEVVAKKKELVWYSIKGWVLPLTHNKDTHGKHWLLRITGIREYSKPIGQEQWQDYLERVQFDYCGRPINPCEKFDDVDVEMIISCGKIVDE